MNRALAIACLLVCWPAPASVFAAAADLEGLDEMVISAMREMDTPGLALAIVDAGGIVRVQGYGTRTMGRGEPVDGETVFNIGSITKSFTATAAGMLVDAGAIAWDTPLGDELAGFAVADSYLSRHLTIRDALAHRSGMPDSGYWVPWPDMTRREVVDRLRYVTPGVPFRSGFLYNNPFFVAAGEVVAARSGKSWDEFVAERIFRPLGMSRTVTSHRDLPRDNVATPHVRIDGVMVPVAHADIDHVAAAGSILSTARDMAQWCALQIGGGPDLIDPQTLQDIHSPQMVGGFDFLFTAGYGKRIQTYGLGWFVFDYRDGADILVAHGGAIDGMRAWMAFSPRHDVCVVSLNNGGEDGDAVNHAIANFIQDRYLGLPREDWLERLVRPVREEIAQDRAKAASLEGHDTSVAPSLPAAGYSGKYSSPLFGDAQVTASPEGLYLKIGINEGPLQHWRGDTYRTNWNRLAEPDGFAIFTVDPRGRVGSMIYEANEYNRQVFDRVGDL